MAKKPIEPKKKKDNSKRNGTLAGLITVFAFANIFGLSNLFSFVFCGLLALGVGSVVRVATAPMKGIEAPTSSNSVRVDNVEDDFARNIVVGGLELLEKLSQERNAVNESIFTRRINDFIAVYREMLNIVVKDNSKAAKLRKMNSYYIPTVIRLLQSYREAKTHGTSYMEISTSRDQLLKTLEQLVQAARTLKKKMIRAKLDKMDDTREVLEDMLRADGYIEDEEAEALRESAAAAAAEMSMPEMMGSAPQPAKAKPAAPVRQPVQVQQPAPAKKPVRRSVVPGVTMSAPQPIAKDAPVPQLQVNAPTASAQQMQQGAPVLHVPGLFPENEPESSEKEETLML